MKLPPIARLRIPILLALALGEVLGLLHFYGQHGFAKFVVFSLQGVYVVTLPMWFGSLRRRGVPGFDILIAVVAGAAAIGGCGIARNVWALGDKADASGSVGVSVFIAGTIVFKLLRPRHASAVREALLFLAYATLVMWLWVRNTSTPWKAVSLLPLLWFAWRVVFHILNRHKSSGDTNSSSEVVTQHGGRA
ncbi:MAG: hypothetical protein ABSB60_05850 [Terracidiphilus sp.]|jgi:hypothetical protein